MSDSELLSFVDGKLSNQSEHFSHLGEGVFTSFLAERNSNGDFLVRGLSRHVGRLFSNADEVGLSRPEEGALRKMLRAALEHWSWLNWQVARVRVIVVPQGRLLIQLEPFRPRFKQSSGISLLPVIMERALPHLKSCSALPSLLAQRQALAAGHDEALLIDRQGQVREGAWSNIFWVNAASNLCTVRERCLAGITQAEIIECAVADGVKVCECQATLDEIGQTATEVFISLSTYGLVPVRAIAGTWRAPDSAGALTKRLLSAHSATKSDTV